MDFTREPIIESIITAKDGHRIVVRSSKNVGHEEYFVDALEVISFGSSVFFRSSERPRPFLVPATDYEVLEVREPRVALKAPSIAGTVRIGPTKEMKESVKESQREVPREQPSHRPSKEPKHIREIPPPEELVSIEEDIDVPPQPRALEIPQEESAVSAQSERLDDRKKDRRGRLRRRKGGRDEIPLAPSAEGEVLTPPALVKEIVSSEKSNLPVVPTALLPPPTTLIRDDIERLRKDDVFKGAFYLKDDQSQGKEGDDDDAPVIPERLTLQDDEPGEEISPDSYKATPAKEVMRDFREPFWIPPRAEEQPKPPEGV